MVAGCRGGDGKIQVVAAAGEADLFEGVDIDGGEHQGSVLCVKIVSRYGYTFQGKHCLGCYFELHSLRLNLDLKTILPFIRDLTLYFFKIDCKVMAFMF